MIREKFGLNEEDGKLMAKVARRSHQINAVYTWEKFQAMGYLWTMIPVINKMYDTEEERIAGYKRHYELFNTNPVVGGFITGLNTAMEMQAAKDNEFDKTGNGFSFANYNSDEMVQVMYNAIDVYYNRPEDWKILVRNAMNTDVSWEKSAETYCQLYAQLHP